MNNRHAGRLARLTAGLAFLTLFVVAFSGHLRAAEAPALTLVRDGASAFTIVIPADAILSERHAAEELRDYLKKISGADLPVAAADHAPPGPRILVGAQSGSEDLGPEEFVIQTEPETQTLRIAGGRPRGALYGVYAFLEDVLGCRWYAPGAERIPQKATIALPGLSIRQAPAFEYREPFFYHAFDPDWAARNRVNGSTPALCEKHGGKITYGQFVHTFNALVPPEKYFDAHPEYYTQISDPGVRDRTQLCVANPEVLDIARKQTLAWMDENPDATIFSVSQNDNINYCKRETDAALEAREGSPAGPLLAFVNAIADEVAIKHPGKFVDTLAYQYTENAPRSLQPRDNVIIRLCHMAPSCDTHPLDTCFWNTNYMKNLRAWTKISNHVYVWHYVTNFSHYLMPFPDVKAIARDMKTYHRNGVAGVFAQGSYQSHGGNLAELKAWLIAKLLWNPDADVPALIDDFFKGYYGPAAEPMLDYFQALHKTVSGPNAHAHLYTAPGALFLPRETLLFADTCFDRAEAAAAGNPDVLARVQRDRLGLTYVKLTAPHLFGYTRKDLLPGGPQDQRARVQQFAADLERLNVTRIDEWHSIEEQLGKIRNSVEEQLKNKPDSDG